MIEQSAINKTDPKHWKLNYGEENERRQEEDRLRKREEAARARQAFIAEKTLNNNMWFSQDFIFPFSQGDEGVGFGGDYNIYINLFPFTYFGIGAKAFLYDASAPFHGGALVSAGLLYPFLKNDFETIVSLDGFLFIGSLPYNGLITVNLSPGFTIGIHLRDRDIWLGFDFKYRGTFYKDNIYFQSISFGPTYSW